jgi:hypothetical protein
MTKKKEEEEEEEEFQLHFIQTCSMINSASS